MEEGPAGAIEDHVLLAVLADAELPGRVLFLGGELLREGRWPRAPRTIVPGHAMVLLDLSRSGKPLSPGGPEDLPLPPTGVPLQGSQQQTPTPPNSNDQALNLDIDNESKPTNTSSTPMETSA